MRDRELEFKLPFTYLWLGIYWHPGNWFWNAGHTYYDGDWWYLNLGPLRFNLTNCKLGD